jgi:hypothetical protein
MTPPPVPKLDIHQALSGLSVPLIYEGPCPGGQVGAAYVRWPDGHRSVLTRGPNVSHLLSLARAVGIPTPEYELVHPRSSSRNCSPAPSHAFPRRRPSSA